MIDLITAAAVEVATNADDREWSVARPSRSVSAVRAASTWPAKWRPWAACVLDRESGGTLDRPQSGVAAQNPSGAAGRWQMMPAWQRGGPYMAKQRLIRHGVSRQQANAVREWMHRHPITTWPGLYQDIVAIEAVERGGWRHWTLPGSRCQGLVPR